MLERPLRVAIAQAASLPGDVAANAARAADTIARAGADLVVFPELSLTGYELAWIAAHPDAWPRPDDARLDPIRRACADARATAVLGAPLRGADGQAHIAAFIVDATGTVHVSCKEHIHSSELGHFAPGKAASPLVVAGWRVAVGICFDAAKPRHAEAAAAHGADVYVVSALYVVGEERRLDLHFGARAMDNRLFTVLANHADTTGGHISCGGSGAWSPTGAPVARAATSAPELLRVDLDPAALRAFR